MPSSLKPSACALSIALLVSSLAPISLAGARPVRKRAVCTAGKLAVHQKQKVRVTVHGKRKLARKWTWVCMPDTGSPTVPTGLKAVPGDGSVALSWTAASDKGGIGAYKVYRDGVAAGTATGTTYNDAGLVNGTTHNYAVAAIDKAGNLSAQSGPVTATPKTLNDTDAPGVPINLTIVPDPATLSVTLRWVAPADNVGVTGYRIYRGGTLVGTSTEPTYVNTGVVHQAEYHYTVAALDAAGNISVQTPSVSTYVS